MAPTAEVAAASPTRRGRPTRVDDSGLGTRERLLDAAVAACVDHGFDATTVGDIAARAGVSGPAIYNHFDGKAELMIAAGRRALTRLRVETVRDERDARAVARAFLADGFAPNRRFLAELHLAGTRHPELARLLSEWHRDQAATWRPRRGTQRDARVAAFFALLLGLCHVDALGAVAPSSGRLTAVVDALVDTLYPDSRNDDRRAGTVRP